MSTTMRDLRVVTRPNAISPPKSKAGGQWTRRFAQVETWAAARAGLISLTLMGLYLIPLAALIAVLAASASNTVVGFVALVLFGAMVLVCIAIAIYVVIPERRQLT